MVVFFFLSWLYSELWPYRPAWFPPFSRLVFLSSSPKVAIHPGPRWVPLLFFVFTSQHQALSPSPLPPESSCCFSAFDFHLLPHHRKPVFASLLKSLFNSWEEWVCRTDSNGMNLGSTRPWAFLWQPLGAVNPRLAGVHPSNSKGISLWQTSTTFQVGVEAAITPADTPLYSWCSCFQMVDSVRRL